MNKPFLLIISLVTVAQSSCLTLPAAINKENAKSVAQGTAALLGGVTALGTTYFIVEDIIKNSGSQKNYQKIVAATGYGLTALYVAARLVPYGVKKFALKNVELQSSEQVYADRKKAAAFAISATALLATTGLLYYCEFSEFKKSILESNASADKALAGAVVGTTGFALYDLMPKIYKNSKHVLSPLFEKKEAK